MRASAGQRVPNEVVGVVADVRYDLRKPPAPTIYILLPLQSFRTLHVRVAGDARRSPPGSAKKCAPPRRSCA